MEKIRLTEAQLHRVIKESVKRIISEMESSTIAQAAGKAGRMAAHSGAKDAVARRIQGKRTKTPHDYAEQAQRLHRGALERASKEDEDWKAKSGEETDYHKRTASMSYNNGRSGKEGNKKLPQFGRRDK